MSAPEESLNDQDPDYVPAISNNQTQQKIYEENARNTTARKITAIVEKEFSLEIDLKEKEILHIQEKLHKALKIFHLLRYVIITNFYNHKQCQVSQTTETTRQTKIHPAVKSLLGKYPKSIYCTDFAVPSTSNDPRFLCNNESRIVSDARITASNTSKEDAYESNKESQRQRVDKKRVLLSSEEESRPRKLPRYVPPKSTTSEDACPSRGNSHKVRKRIVVGNISKWIPPDWREDTSSHKWMMYVRGDKDNANISAFVSKVRFFLHPSYRPNDVVEITTYPFHLSRRGWGEFPVRVQLHFKHCLNKPMDIIHHLKLDRTYTGLQTLGSETLVDVWINTTESRNLPQSSDSKSIASSTDDIVVKLEPTNIFECKQMEESEKVSQLAAYNFEESRVKQESNDNSEVCELFDPTLYLTLTENSEKSENIKVKDESSNIAEGTKENELTLQEMCQHIDFDHDYCGCKQYSDSHHCIVKEENVTIEHLTDNHVQANNSAVMQIDSNENEKTNSDDVTILLHRCNGIKSSSDLQIINSVIPDAANSQVTKSKNLVLQEANSQKSPILSDTMMILQAKYSQNDNDYKLSENTSIKDTSMIINGFCKSSNDQLNSMQSDADSSKCDSHLKPLQITIPPNVLMPSDKHVVLLKDKKSIPVDMINILSLKLKTKKLVDDDATVFIAKDSNVAKVNVQVPQGISILKKSVNNKTNVQQDTAANNSKKTAVLTLKDENSILLNVNEDVPILKIVDPNDPRYNYNFSDTTKCLSSELSVNKQELCTSLDKSVVQRTKITLGKDKYKIQSKRDLYEMVFRSIDTANITDTQALIRYVIRRLPIVTSDASDPEYRQLHPYACRNEEEFFACNIGKQRALEWYRARTIKYFLQKKLIPVDQLWSVKEIVIWARLHGYTPIRNIFNVAEAATTSDTKKLPDTLASTSTHIVSTCTEPVALQKWLQIRQQDSNHQLTDDCIDVEEIDVESIGDVTCKATIDRRKTNNQNNNCRTTSLIPLELDKNLLPFHDFVCDTAQNIGIKIGSEEIVPGVLYCAASRVIMRVVECFVEDLTRSSLAKAWERNDGNKYPKIITPNDVRSALMSREEFDIFTNKDLGSKQQLDMANVSSL